MLYIKIQNVKYKKPIFAPPAGPKSSKLYIKIRKVIYKFQKPQKISRLRRKTPMYINFKNDVYEYSLFQNLLRRRFSCVRRYIGVIYSLFRSNASDSITDGLLVKKSMEKCPKKLKTIKYEPSSALRTIFKTYFEAVPTILYEFYMNFQK